MLKYRHDLKPLARRLRSDLTDAEQKLWFHLRRKQIGGIQFYRQRPIGEYIVDFVAPSAKLVVEVDGSQHADVQVQKNDAMRTTFLTTQGFHVMRFDKDRKSVV